MKTIMVVEDERDVRELIILHLKRAGHQVIAFESAELARSALQSGQKPALIILDWMLPGQSGLEFARFIRETWDHTIGILLLTARADTLDKVLGLEVGADDYLTKPFEIREFQARVTALLRRIQGEATEEQVIEYGPFQLDEVAKRILVHGRELVLTPHEFKLLAALLSHPTKTFEREELITTIQGPEIKVVDRVIDTTVLGLRKKLGADAEYIETVRGFGYRMKSLQ